MGRKSDSKDSEKHSSQIQVSSQSDLVVEAGGTLAGKKKEKETVNIEASYHAWGGEKRTRKGDNFNPEHFLELNYIVPI